MIESLAALVGLMRQDGATRIYAKKLAPNDNSKNQIYLGGDFSALNIVPYHGIYTDDANLAGSVRDRAKADIAFFWIDEQGLHEAPHAQLILYPKYPEVRMSGFLKGCRNAPSDVMRVRDEGRVLFLGITRDGRVFGHAVFADHPIAKEIHAKDSFNQVGVFLDLSATTEDEDTKSKLLATLREVYRKHWIPSQKLGPDGLPHPYRASNGGGYTLEAELGISPNGYAEPDYLGWEIKQYGVRDFSRYAPKSPVTLMTPEPSGGIYKDAGVETFVRRYGYPDKSGKPDRINFGGKYACDRTQNINTGLRLRMIGFDAQDRKITDMSGGIVLLDEQENVAAL